MKKTRKIMGLFLALVLTFALSVPAMAQVNAPAEPQLYLTLYVVNCRESITLRTSPSTTAAEISQIPKGAAVSYVETSADGFYKIMYMGDTGYALASYLATDPNASSTCAGVSAPDYSASYQTMYVVNCHQSITLRTSDNVNASEITQIPLGAAVSYVGNANNGFFRVVYNGWDGYALASYLSVTYIGGAKDNVGYSDYNTGSYVVQVVNCNESITLRTYPDVDAPEICQIPLGTYITYLCWAENNFAYVSYNGCTGYALANYLAD